MTDFEYGKHVPISRVIGTIIPVGSLNWHNKITTSFNLIFLIPLSFYLNVKWKRYASDIHV